MLAGVAPPRGADGGKCDELLDVRKRTAMPDWPALMPDVAVALLGEPSSRTGRELRYGRRGSLSVDLAGGRWFDHEAGEGGGVVELVTRERGGDTTAAMAWLESAGFVEPQSGQHAVRGSVSRSEAVSPPVATTPPDANTQERAALATRLWDAAGAPDGSPGRIYLAARWAWPPVGIGPDLPASVRWLPREAAPGPVPDAKWRGLPDGAIGALVFGWRAPGETNADTAAVSLEALDRTGRRPDQSGTGRRWRRTFGPRRGAVFTVPGRTVPGPLAVCEGEVDALALALSPWCEASEIRAAGGTSGINANAATDPDAARPIVLYPDGDPSGRVRMTRAAVALQAAGRIVEIECCAPGEDPATVLADELAERAAIREFEGGADCDDADHGAWTDFFEKEKNR